jgi:ComF family protein
VAAAVDYAWPWDRWVQRLKFENGLDLADPMAALCAKAWLDHPPQAQAEIAARTVATLVVPVPLSARRLRQRGYNQAWELARRIAARLDLPARADALLRLKDTRAQTEIGLLEREANLADGFAAEPRALPMLAGRSILLVDDVLTTGATAHAASLALRQAGAGRVDVCVFALTPPPSSGPVPSSSL